MTVRLLGIQIANGYSPEARVFAGLLAHTDSSQIDCHVLHHSWDGDRESALQFEAGSGATVRTMDFGWRSVAADRSLSDKVRGRCRFLASLPRALAHARKADPDVVYSCQQFWDCQAATYIARRLGKPQIIHLHYVVGPWLHRPVLDRLRTCDHVVAISDYIRAEALRHEVPLDRVTTLRNTITVPAEADSGTREAVRRELGLPSEAPVLGIIARLDPAKGQADTLQAFAQARHRFPTAHLLLVGSETPWCPGYEDSLKTMARQLGVTGQTRFLGRRSDVPRLLSAMDIFVHPSRQEPFGLAVAEASAAGLPVVAYAEGGTCEIVQDGVTGLLAASGDVGALAARLVALLEAPLLAGRMGKAGQQSMRTDFRPEAAGVAFHSLLQTTSGVH